MATINKANSKWSASLTQTKPSVSYTLSTQNKYIDSDVSLSMSVGDSITLSNTTPFNVDDGGNTWKCTKQSDNSIKVETSKNSISDDINIQENLYIQDKNNNLKNILDIMYPVGTVYMSYGSMHPNIGTWQAIHDVFLFSEGTATTDEGTGIVSGNGGSFNLPTEKHTHSATTTVNNTSIGAHTHTISITGRYPDKTTQRGGDGGSRHFYSRTATTISLASNGGHTHTINAVTTGSSGSSNSNLNMPKYSVVNMWERIS